MPNISISIVSHGQSAILSNLINDLSRLDLFNIEVVFTVNIPDDESIFGNINFNHLIIRNSIPKGFGANHNAAFQASSGKFFVVLNPDVRINSMNWNILLSTMLNARVSSVAPLILNSSGAIEDSVRRFPTFRTLIVRILFRKIKNDYHWLNDPIEVDWTAGMFIVFRRDAFVSVGGFDDSRFFMYYEDVDICYRLFRKGWLVIFDPRIKVVHDAQRASHRNLKHLKWHITSALRYLTGL